MELIPAKEVNKGAGGGYFLVEKDFGGVSLFGTGETPEQARIDFFFTVLRTFLMGRREFECLGPRLRKQFFDVEAFLEQYKIVNEEGI